MGDTCYLLYPNTSIVVSPTPSWLVLWMSSAHPARECHMGTLQVFGPVLWSDLNLIVLLCVGVAGWRNRVWKRERERERENKRGREGGREEEREGGREGGDTIYFHYFIA